MEIDAQTKVASLIGHPVSHSFSPYIHNFLAERYGVNLCYVALDVEPEKVSEAVRGIGALGLIGSNVTIPHKIAVMDSLDEIDEHAKIIGAVNTIKNDQGRLIGYNTDGVGFVKSVLDQGHELKGKHAMILGAGGASRAIAVELAASGVRKITIRNHTLSKAEKLAEEVKGHFKEVIFETGVLEFNAKALEEVDFLINTTPLGMSKKKDLCPIDESIIPHKALVVCDIVYTPHDTKLLKWAMKNNLSVVHGIGMLINQALHSFYIWTGIDVHESYDEVLNLLVEKKVI